MNRVWAGATVTMLLPRREPLRCVNMPYNVALLTDETPNAVLTSDCRELPSTDHSTPISHLAECLKHLGVIAEDPLEMVGRRAAAKELMRLPPRQITCLDGASEQVLPPPLESTMSLMSTRSIVAVASPLAT